MDWKKHEKLLATLKNKYVLTIVLFIVWMSFFDRNNLVSRYKYRQELNKLVDKKAYYNSEIEKNKEDMKALMSDQDDLEKFAREKYLMKKDDEDIFIIIKEEKQEAPE